VLLGLAEIGDLQRQQAGPILDIEIFRLQPRRTMIQVGSGAQPPCLLGLLGSGQELLSILRRTAGDKERKAQQHKAPSAP
jgi:hypothetical protein